MAEFTYPLVIWKEYHRYAVVSPGTKRVKWADTMTLEWAQRWATQMQERQVPDRLVRVSSYPFQEDSELWTAVVDWF